MPQSPLKPLYLVTAAALMLGACTQQGPWPMPTGYTYEHGQYQAPPGPKPVFKKWEYDHGVKQEPQTLGTQLDQPATGAAATGSMPMLAEPDSWDQASRELVSRLVGDFGHPAEAVWLQADPGASDASVNFDKALRGALEAQQVHLAGAPGAGPFTLHYAVANADGGKSLLTITLMSAGKKAAEESGIYTLSSTAHAAEMTPAPEMAPAAEPGPPVALEPQRKLND